jgi:hypothetical protein
MEKFEIVSGNVIVSDPCYSLNTWCQGELSNVKKGVWNVKTTKLSKRIDDARISEIIVKHDDNHRKNLAWEMQGFEVGVDSGQAGIFDKDYYQKDEVVKGYILATNPHTGNPIADNDPWYSVCCKKTLSKEGYGVIPYGAVSSSGYGDGGYTCYTSKNKMGEIDAIKIVFIDENYS